VDRGPGRHGHQPGAWRPVRLEHLKGAIVDSIKAGGEGAFTWNIASANDPYALACLAFAFSMIIAGRMQDKIGPRATCIIGGLLVVPVSLWPL